MTAVRPPLWPQAQSAPVNRGAQSPAQKAFFDAAMGRAAGAAPTPAAAPVEPVQTRTPTYASKAKAPQPQAPAEGEVKYRRPGSIIDIRV